MNTLAYVQSNRFRVTAHWVAFFSALVLNLLSTVGVTPSNHDLLVISQAVGGAAALGLLPHINPGADAPTTGGTSK